MDWIDEADGVFRGGGVKGLGIAGALLGFAEHETKPVKKWVSVAGASAGAIIACYLAVGHDADDIEKLLKETQFGEFQDFPPGGKILGGIPNLVRNHGLARGDAFRDWFSGVLEHKTFAAVRADKKDGTRDWRLKLISVDVTNRDLLVLPDDLARYKLDVESQAIDPDTFELADAARMSMSIPYFFEPVVLVRDRVFVEDAGDTTLPRQQPVDRVDVVAKNARIEQSDGRSASFRELTSDEQQHQRSTCIDGGTLSNFPVWLFDARPGEELTRPTFGFTLSGGKGVGAGFNELVAHLAWPIRFGFDIFHTSQEAWDERFVSHSTRVRTLAVDAGTIGTTDFNLTPSQQDQLIQNGRDAAKAFLDRFNLDDYINTYHRHLGGGNGGAPATPSEPGAAVLKE